MTLCEDTKSYFSYSFSEFFNILTQDLDIQVTPISCGQLRQLKPSPVHLIKGPRKSKDLESNYFNRSKVFQAATLFQVLEIKMPQTPGHPWDAYSLMMETI